MDEDETCWPKRRLNKQRKQYEIKKAKVAGIEHINHVGNKVAPRVTGKECR